MKRILNIILIIVLFSVFGLLLWKNSPISSGYYFYKGKKLFDANNYMQASNMFKIAHNKSPENELYLYFYVAALSKLEPDYFVQKSMYELAHIKCDNIGKELAKSNIFHIRKLLLDGFEDNYIFNAVSNKDIIHWNINDFPLRVYIKATNDIPEYYNSNILNALSEWERRTGFISFKFVDNPDKSNIVILFRKVTNSNCDNNHCQFVAAVTEPSINSDNKLSKMTVTFYKTNPFGDYFSEKEIYHTALHELGHALGIIGHSDHNSDIMYSNNHNIYGSFAEARSNLLDISMRDLRTIALLYKIYPTITNSAIKNKSNYIYPPIIFGDDEQILQNKLDELERYIKNYPNEANGYINISGVYSQMGENEKALESLNIAESYAKNIDDNFIIEYNRAVIYFNTQKFNLAKKHIKNGLKFKNDPNLHAMLDEINKIDNK